MFERMNEVILEGNLARDPELKLTPNEKYVCDIVLAYNAPVKKDQQKPPTDYFDIELWNKIAVDAAEHLKVGREVRIYGKLKQESWKNKDGENRTKVIIHCRRIVYGSKLKNEKSEKIED